jgi:DNA-binding SARP family transcriptional activator
MIRSQLAVADETTGALESGTVQASINDAPIQPDGSPSGLIARVRELAHLDHVLWRARRGVATVVALRGEPGVGKSALIEATLARANDFAVVQLRGTALAGRTDRGQGAPRSLVDLASEERAEDGRARMTGALESMVRSSPSPVLVAVDDCHLLPRWFPEELAQVVATGLADSPIAVVLAWSDPPHLPSFELEVPIAQHRLGGLSLDQARALLLQQHRMVPAATVLASLMGATGGNPHALLDTCNRLGPDELYGWRPLPEPTPLSETVALAFGERVLELDDEPRKAVAAAAAGRIPVDVLELVLDELDLSTDALVPAEEAGILVVRGNRLDFLHPLVRAAAFHLAPESDQTQIQQATGRAFGRSGHVERSAFHASQGRLGPDDGLTRLYGQAARVALDRGDPDAAARHEELASSFAEGSDSRAHHLARAAGLWLSAGESSRALVCLDRASELHPTGVVLAEVEHQRARVGSLREVGRLLSEAMVDAAALCEPDAPHRAVLMLVDAVACKLLDGGSVDTVEIAERALALAGSVSSHAEALARAALAAVIALEGREGTVEVQDARSAAALLIGQTQRFSASPHLAYVIGAGLLHAGHREQAYRWAQWIERCAETVNDRALAVVPPALCASIALRDGRLSEALAAGEVASERAARSGDYPLAARVLAGMVEAHAARGDYEQAFHRASRLFALTSETGREPRMQALGSLAVLELQRGRAASAFAWLRAADDETVALDADGGAVTYRDPVWARWSPQMAEVMVLGRRDADITGLRDLASLVDVTNRAMAAGAVPRAWMHWVDGMAEPEVDAAAEHLRAALSGVRGEPLTEARIEMIWGVRLSDAGMTEEARSRLQAAAESFAVREAAGWVALVEQELDRLPTGPAGGSAEWYGDSGDEPAAIVERRSEARGGVGATAQPAWEICLLGSFSVRRDGKEVSLPLSLAAQGLKIVTLREKIPVEELVELLWTDAEPGVGTRRLRNVLWRVRAACGDLLQRDGNFIRLAPGTTTDVSRFRSLAEAALALDARSDSPVQLARQALDLYRGELLPGDRYADWASASRESLARLHLQLLDLLLAEAVSHQHRQEALSLLDRLIEADPYDEHYYLQAAELQVQAGNRRRALSLIGRAERMLSDLGVPPSPALVRARNSLGAP